MRELRKIGVQPVGKMVYELADGTVHEYPFGLVRIEFMGEITAGRVIFGPKAVSGADYDPPFFCQRLERSPD